MIGKPRCSVRGGNVEPGDRHGITRSCGVLHRVKGWKVEVRRLEPLGKPAIQLAKQFVRSRTRPDGAEIPLGIKADHELPCSQMRGTAGQVNAKRNFVNGRAQGILDLTRTCEVSLGGHKAKCGQGCPKNHQKPFDPHASPPIAR